MEHETVWDAMARGQRARARDRVMADTWGPSDKDDAKWTACQ